MYASSQRFVHSLLESDVAGDALLDLEERPEVRVERREERDEREKGRRARDPLRELRAANDRLSKATPLIYLSL